MSKYLVIETVITDEAILADALKQVSQEMGFEWERHQQPESLVGYQGRQREETAEFIVRRHQLGRASNDLGWKRKDGKFQVIVSEFDHSKNRTMNIVNEVRDAYAIIEATRAATANGYTVTPVKNGDGKVVQLTLARY